MTLIRLFVLLILNIKSRFDGPRGVSGNVRQRPPHATAPKKRSPEIGWFGLAEIYIWCDGTLNIRPLFDIYDCFDGDEFILCSVHAHVLVHGERPPSTLQASQFIVLEFRLCDSCIDLIYRKQKNAKRSIHSARTRRPRTHGRTFDTTTREWSMETVVTVF